ncbi:MAG: hypothetical protein ACE5HS_08725 [bacterium]
MKGFQFSCCLWLALATASLAQETTEPQVIHELVGDKIDKAEREKYQLFSSVENFQSAIFYKSDSSTFVLQLETFEDGKTHQQTIPVSWLYLQDIRGQIEKVAESQRTPTLMLKTIEKERKRGRELFPGYAGSLFGGWVTNLFVFGLNGGSGPSRMELYLVWGMGSAFFCAAGVQTAGQFDDGWRTFGAAFLGGLAGTAVGILAFEGSLQTENAGLVGLVILFGKPLLTSFGAIQGYYAAARTPYKGVLNLNKHGMRLNMPALDIQLQKDLPAGERPTVVYRMSLINVRF